MTPKKQAKAIRDPINLKPSLDEPDGAMQKRPRGTKPPQMKVEDFELQLLEARKLRITKKTSNHSLGKLQNHPELGEAARKEKARRLAAKPPSKTTAYNTLKKHLTSGSTNAKKIAAIHQTLKTGNPKSIARIVKRAAEEVKAKRSKKYTTKKISKQAVAAERARAKAANKKRKNKKSRGGHDSWEGPGFYPIGSGKRRPAKWFDKPEDYHAATAAPVVPVAPKQAAHTLKPSNPIQSGIERIMAMFRHGRFEHRSG